MGGLYDLMRETSMAQRTTITASNIAVPVRAPETNVEIYSGSIICFSLSLSLPSCGSQKFE